MDYGNIIQISQGYENPNDLSTQQSLINTLLQKPDFANMLYQAYPYYSLMSTSGISFNDLSVQFTGDRQFRYSVLPRSDNPLTYLSTVSGTGVGNSIFTITCLEGYGQPYGVFRLPEGQLIQIQGAPTENASYFNYDCKIVTNDTTDTFTTPNTQDKLGHVAGFFPEGSQRGYGTIMYPDWLSNYTSITRDEYKITRSAATSVTWLTVGDAKFWIPGSAQAFQSFFSGDGGYLYQKEKAYWTAVTTMDSNGNCTNIVNGEPIIMGNGFQQQISGAMTSTYNLATFSESWIQDALAMFTFNAGVGEAKIDVHTGSGGYSIFQKAMKLYMDRRLRYNSDASTTIRTVAVGEKVTVFYINDAYITVYKNPILSDPNLFTKLDNSGFPAESFNFYLVENSNTDGIPTLQRVAKNNSSLIVSEVPGIGRSIASTAFDGTIYEALSEDMLVVRKPNRIGKWTRSA